MDAQLPPAPTVSDFKWLVEAGPWALGVVVVLWLLYWVPKWIKQGFERYDATIQHFETAREGSKAQHEQTITALSEQHARMVESANERSSNIVTAFREESKAEREAFDERSKLDREACEERSNRTIDALTREISRAFDRRPV